MDGWRDIPPNFEKEKKEIILLYSPNAKTIMVFTFLSPFLFFILLYYSIIAYNEGYYYLYQLVQDGESSL